MKTQRGSRNEFQAIRGLLADAALDRALLGLGRLDLALKNWETQPRAPAGQSDGGRWVMGPSGAPLKLPPTSWSSLRDGEPGADQEPSVQTGSVVLDDGNRVLWLKIRDRSGQIEEQHAIIAPSGESRIFKDFGNIQTVVDGETNEILSSSYFTPNGIEPSPIFQPAYSPDKPKRANKSLLTFQLAISFFEFLSRREDGYGPVLGLTAQEYSLDDPSKSDFPVWVKRLSQSELDAACPRNGEVQEIYDEASAKITREGNFKNAQDRGTKIHAEAARVVNAQKDPNFVAELALTHRDDDGNFTLLGALKSDVFERTSMKTACIYDGKTGVAGLTPKRALALVVAARRLYANINRFFIIQVRPRQ